MNLALHDSISGRQRCRQWSPLLTQQLRVRHLYQIIGYNLGDEVVPSEGFYYTLHTTLMCAPFYTSETISSSNPKWSEIEFDSESNISSRGFVLRVWQKSDIVLTWGVNLSGLLYLGNKLSEIQPESFEDNSVIFYLRGGYFTSLKHVRINLGKPVPSAWNLSVVGKKGGAKLCKATKLKFPLNDVRNTYSVGKLRRLHSLQIRIRNSSLDVKTVREKIESRDGRNEVETVATSKADAEKVEGNVRYAPQLLTMMSLNKMLQEKPTKVQKREIVRIRKEIENIKLKTKILAQEKSRKQFELWLLKERYSQLCDDNELRDSNLMEDYRNLSKKIEKLKEWKIGHSQQKEVLQQLTRQLHNRRRQLMSDMLHLYPIESVGENKFTINGVYLPPSDMLTDCSDGGLSVALGYVTHILIMCASFLQVPLRYPLQHFGSRSVVEDHISVQLLDKSREFPLYTRGKDRIQFNYAVYLLNKNIAQYLYLLGARTPDLKATLPNVLALLQGKEYKHDGGYIWSKIRDLTSQADSLSKDAFKFELDLARKPLFGSTSNVNDPILDSIRNECQMERSKSPTHSRRSGKCKKNEPGLSQILAIPEAYMSRQMSTSTFKNYMQTKAKVLEDENNSTDSSKDTILSQQAIIPEKICDKKDDSIEEATEILPSPNSAVKHQPIDIIKNGTSNAYKHQKRLSRSVGSYTDEERSLELPNNLELGSDPLINVSSDTNNSFRNRSADELAEDGETSQQQFLQKWLDDGPTLICSEESLYPDEYLGTVARGSNEDDSPLTLRTDALLKTKSFNLVKPKM